MNNPATAKVVNPTNFASSFGSGIRCGVLRQRPQLSGSLAKLKQNCHGGRRPARPPVIAWRAGRMGITLVFHKNQSEFFERIELSSGSPQLAAFFISNQACDVAHRHKASVCAVQGHVRSWGYTIVQRYTRERVSYWLCRPAALELRRSQDGRNAVCLRRAEG